MKDLEQKLKLKAQSKKWAIATLLQLVGFVIALLMPTVFYRELFNASSNVVQSIFVVFIFLNTFILLFIGMVWGNKNLRIRMFDNYIQNREEKFKLKEIFRLLALSKFDEAKEVVNSIELFPNKVFANGLYIGGSLSGDHERYLIVKDRLDELTKFEEFK